MSLKYKKLTSLLIIFVTVLVALTALFSLQNLPSSRVSALDPVPTCGTGATLVNANGDNPAYCSCPSGQVLVTDTNDCESSCPANYTAGVQFGVAYCNPPNNSSGSPAGSNCASGSTASSSSSCGVKLDNPTVTKYQCGTGKDAVVTSIDFGCKGDSCVTNATGIYCNTDHSAITDMLFAIIRFLSDGVGLVLVGSLIVGGIQYSSSRGDPQSTSKAIGRIRSTMVALLIYVFAYAILNYIIPAGFLK